MRILHVPHAYPPVIGGAETHCAELSVALALLGHEVTVLTSNASSHKAYDSLPSWVEAPPSEVARGVMVKRVPVFTHALLMTHRLLHTFLPGRVASRLWQPFRHRQIKCFKAAIRHEILQAKPDVVMTMPHHLANVQCVVELARQMGFPLVMVPLLHPGWSADTKLWFKAAFRRANALVANTSAEAAEMASAYEVPVEKTFVGWLGVSGQLKSTEKGRKRQVLFLGRIVPAKNIPFLVSAMLKVWEQHPDVTLVVAGARSDDSHQVEAKVGGLAGENSSRIVFAFDVTDEAKQILLAESICLVLPSANESFGIVLLEAMASRTPVIALDLPVFRSFITHQTTGLLVAPENPSAMSAAINSLIDDEILAKRIGRAGSQLVSEHFTWSAVAKCYLQAYEYAIGSTQIRNDGKAGTPSDHQTKKPGIE